ncbi:DEAD/DEAH box helicase [Flaviflexus massiliensis]|uniref:DEAD/DEAH box helicase n=1 Tax=Flaviflexus massiliensis TaxID=1522309 RepID=UPI0006D56B69|nr:DEAD/DEAH box helicase [Flaviflexus massiliensis]
MGIYLDNFSDAVSATGITLDSFQEDAARALEEGRDVLLCAPTGAGKTMVALFAVEMSFATSTTCIYTTPVKALSNQKYRELVARYGSEYVGLMTGDVTINRGANIVVMTTEVLRNLLYAGEDLKNLGYVILDEVHYLADPERGPTWEEVILELDTSVRIVSLSATIANADEFHSWLESVRGNTTLVQTSLRPVPLRQQLVVGRKLHDLYEGGASATLGAGRNPNERALGSLSRKKLPERIGPGQRYSLLRLMSERDLLPAIEFIFSRKGCDQAVADLVKDNVSLTTRNERRLIHQALDPIREQLTDQDKAVLRFRSFERALANGYAAHHAGVYPPFKELIESLMQRGLIKIVYATGTLALGINMPVRTTVIESLTKFNGTEFTDLTGIEYTQLIGRAGRRGKDEIGHALVYPTTDTDTDVLLTLGAGELEPLESAFFPSYNTVVNVLADHDYESARALLARSFAQYQRNREVTKLEVTRERVRLALDEEAEKLRGMCEAGDVADYARLRSSSARASSSARKKAKKAYRHRVADSFEYANGGEIIAYAYGTSLEYAYVTQVDDDRLRVATWLGDLVWLTPESVRSELRHVGDYVLPAGMKLRDPSQREVLADKIAEFVEDRVTIGLDEDLLKSWDRGAVRETPELLEHPVHSCPDREKHLEEATAFLSLSSQLRHLDSLRESYDDSVGAEFDATCDLLATVGVLQGERGAYVLGSGAAPLRRLHSNADLLIYECLKDPHFAGLSPVMLAGMLSCFAFKERRGRARPPADPLAWRVIRHNHEYLSDLEERFGLARQPEISSHPTTAVVAWAEGATLQTCLTMSQFLPGDFINGLRRTADLLTQVMHAAEGTPVGDSAATARRLIDRPGVTSVF